MCVYIYIYIYIYMTCNDKKWDEIEKDSKLENDE